MFVSAGEAALRPASYSKAAELAVVDGANVIAPPRQARDFARESEAPRRVDRPLKIQARIIVIVLDAAQRRHIVHRRIGLLGQQFEARELAGIAFGLAPVRHRLGRTAAPPCAKVHQRLLSSPTGARHWGTLTWRRGLALKDCAGRRDGEAAQRAACLSACLAEARL